MGGRSLFRAVFGAALLTVLAAGGMSAAAAQRPDEAARRARAAAAPSVPVAARALGSFTPSVGDAAGATLRAGAAPDLRTFRFTPSGQVSSKALTLGLRARPLAAPDARRTSDDVAGYDMGVSLAARGVALTGTTSQIDTGLQQKQAVTMGLGYGRRDWTAQVRVGEERMDLRGADKLGTEKRYSIELGGAYTLTRSLSVGAGVRYRVAPQAQAVQQDDRAAYLGLGVSF